MTDRAIGEPGGIPDMIGGLEIQPEPGLIGRRRPILVPDLLGRPKLPLRVTMAGDAELHLERVGLVGELHGVDGAMTGRTADPLGDVDRVIEIDVAGQPVEPDPLQRLVLGQALAHGGQICEWQVMQVQVGGMPAVASASTC